MVQDVLDRMDEPTDLTGSGVSDWLEAVQRAVVRAFHDLLNRFPWWFLIKDPPGAFVTVAPITTLTITVATPGTSVAGTLSATYASSLAGYKIRPTGKDWSCRITAHTAGTAAVTLDAVPAALAAGSAITIFQDEYNLASDLGLFVDGLWAQDGTFIEVWSQERLKKEYPDPPDPGWPPVSFCRLGPRKIRFSQYPDAVKRVEYPYTTRESDPSGTGDLVIPQQYRWVLSDGGLFYAYLLKSDKRAPTARQDFERAIEQMYSYHERTLRGVGFAPETLAQGPYR